jgi:MoaA/NifB/PqqE/SkfB family radical SAM enzyme
MNQALGSTGNNTVPSGRTDSQLSSRELHEKAAMFIFTTKRCNLTCRHCYVRSGPTAGEHMEAHVFDRAITLARSMQITDVRLTGGEPTIHPQFEKQIEILMNTGFSTRLISNGKKLIGLRTPERVLRKLSSCWISIYGITDAQHAEVAGIGANQVEKVLQFVGSHDSSSCAVGVGVSVQYSNLKGIEGFLERVIRNKVRRIRFMFIEPTGRAVDSPVLFYDRNISKREANWSNWLSIIERYQGYFDHLTVSDPAGKLSPIVAGESSCLLRRRSMWSISHKGDIYSCCYNIETDKHKVAGIFDSDIAKYLGEQSPSSFESDCGALSEKFWSDFATTGRCPLSNIRLTAQ